MDPGSSPSPNAFPSPSPSPSPPSPQNYYAWGTAVYATLTAAAIVLSVAACLVMLNRSYWRPRRMRAAAAAAAATGRQGYPPDGVDDAEENGLAPGGPSASKQPVIVVQPGGCVDLAIKGGAEEDRAPGGHALAASQDLEAQSTGAGEARAPRQRGTGGWVAPSPLASPSTSVQMIVRPLSSWSPASRPQVLMAWPSLQLHEVTPQPAMYYPPPRRPQRGPMLPFVEVSVDVADSDEEREEDRKQGVRTSR
ncbi:hypothetical protein ACKKBG_A06065 [Auxenochlorella protothecoides x Auxenochlorella symbiontica]